MSSKQNSTTSPYLLIFALGLCGLVTLTAVFIQSKHRVPVPVVSPQTVTIPLIKVVQPNAFFFSKIFLNRNKTFVSIPYQFSKVPQTLWLSLETQPGTQRIDLLMSHPSLTKLNWDSVTSPQGITLFQKKKQYSSVDQFVANPPKNSLILADPSFKKNPAYSKLTLQALPDDPQAVNLPQVDYILTTYNPHVRTANQINFYETIIDATKAKPNVNNELVWLIFAPFATDKNPLYLGDIHVDYRQ